ncbi:hypothetical protein SUDANB121_05931 (plasmid) [Nocardiopsis dassonvillei]|uniref:hypothetical protein n=1 Tax=Nocardiopsis dassonvillei TaxID=2014 RepID=UPI003F5775CB
MERALTGSGPLQELAQWLRSLRQQSGLTYRQMARKAEKYGFPTSYSVLCRAAGGTRRPTWTATEAYMHACLPALPPADAERARQHTRILWEATDPRRMIARRRVRPDSHPPDLIAQPLQLIDAMNALRLRAGDPTLRALEQWATVSDQHGQVSHLPRSTLGAVLRGSRMPSKELFMTFVHVVIHRTHGTLDQAVDPIGWRKTEARQKIAKWEDAWDRAWCYRHGF